MSETDLAARLEELAGTQTWNREFAKLAWEHKADIIAALRAGDAERIATVIRCAKIVRELGPSGSSGSMAAAMERNAVIIARVAKEDELVAVQAALLPKDTPND